MNVRTCKGNELVTGGSKCPLNREKIIGAIVVQHGYKLPEDLSGEALEEACHADRPARLMPIKEFVEYAKNGGEVQTSAVGYGPNQASDVNAWTDAFTADAYNEALSASLLKTMNTVFDVYFYDKDNVIYGLNDGTEQLAGFPMSSIYPTVIPFPTSGAKESLVVNFCYKDARTALEDANYMQVDFDIPTFACGLTPVQFVATGTTNKYKLVEKYGNLDRTAEFGSIIATSAESVLVGGPTGVTYDAATETLTISGSTAPQLASPSALYTAKIKGIVQA